MCKQGSIGRTWSKDVILGRKSVYEAAGYFGMSIEDVQEHLDKHEINVDEEKGVYESTDFYMNQFLKILKQLKDWMNYVTMVKDPDQKTMEVGLKVMKEIRLTLSDLAELQGKKEKSGNITVQIENMNMRYTKLTNLLMVELCDECRMKVIDLLDEQANGEPLKEISSI